MTARLNSLDSLLWQRAGGSGGPIALSDAVSEASDPPEPVTVATVISDGWRPAERIAWAKGAKVRSLGAVTLVRIPADDGPFVVSTWPIGDDPKSTTPPAGFHVVGTVPATDGRWKFVERLMARAAPHVVPAYLDEVDVDRIGVKLSEFGRVEVSRVTARYLHDHSSVNRGWAASKRQLRPTFSEVLTSFEHDASVRTLTVHVDDVLSLHLRRNGGATFYSGRFDIFENVVMRSLAQATTARRRLLAGRERRLREPAQAPIKIRLVESRFHDATALGDLIALLRQQRSFGVAVLHRNPYLHIAVTDYLDGSNFDTFVTQPDEVTIHPGYRSSLGSLARFTQYLSEELAAREVSEAEPLVPLSMDDLLTAP